jgi:hypothetical protein
VLSPGDCGNKGGLTGLLYFDAFRGTKKSHFYVNATEIRYQCLLLCQKNWSVTAVFFQEFHGPDVSRFQKSNACIREG